MARQNSNIISKFSGFFFTCCLGQIKVLDILNQERAAAERKNIIYRTEQRVAQLREEALMTQVPITELGFYFFEVRMD